MTSTNTEPEAGVEEPVTSDRKHAGKSRKKKTRTPVKPNASKKGYKHDWEAVRSAYCEGIGTDEDPLSRTWPSLNEVAQRFQITSSQVRDRSAREHWPEQRQAYQQQLATTRMQRRAIELSREAVEFDAKALSTAKLGMAMVTARISEIARLVQLHQGRRAMALERLQQGLPVQTEDLLSAIDSRELDTLARAGLQWHQLGQKALGEDVIRHEISGPEGGPIEMNHTSVTEALTRDDPERLAAFLQAAKQAHLLDDDDIIDVAPEDDEEEYQQPKEIEA